MAAVETTFTVCGESKAGLQVLGGEIGKVGENLLFGHPAGQVIQDIIDRDAQPADARFPPPRLSASIVMMSS